MFIDVKKAHLYATCDEEEWVELLAEFKKFGKYAKLKRWLHGMRKAVSVWEDDYARRLVNDRFPAWQSSFNDILPPIDSRACRCAWPRLHLRSHGAGAEEDAIEDVRMVRRHGAWYSWQWKT